jgi:hypothetical protein
MESEGSTATSDISEIDAYMPSDCPHEKDLLLSPRNATDASSTTEVPTLIGIDCSSIAAFHEADG